MKSMRKVLFVFLIALLFVTGVSAQSLKGISFNGATGLYNIPTGRIGWEKRANLGLDLGYHAIVADKLNHIPKVNLSLFKWVEIHGAFDIHPSDDRNAFLIGAKLQLPTTSTAIAIGGNFQVLKEHKNNTYNAGQIYMAVTYPGSFFKMPAETTVVVGKTFREGRKGDTNIDFGMGFDLLLFPKVFQNYIHWIVDFSNFDYSGMPWSLNSGSRGSLNTGIRIDLAASAALSKFKFVIDLTFTDLLDSNRAFAFGAAFGIPVM